MNVIPFAILVSAIALASCENNDASNVDGDSTSRFERGVAKVGEKLETAAADVGVEVKESRIQMMIDNVKGLDSVQVEITEDGTVTLIGSVASTDVGNRAMELVQNIEGVENVRNSITVGSVPMVDSAAAQTGTDSPPADTTK